MVYFNINLSKFNLVFRNWFFTDFETKISRFKQIKSQFESQNQNLAENKKILNQILIQNSQPDLIYDKLNPVIYLGKTEEDIHLILNCIRK